MPARPRAAVSWSGGKDSCAALERAAADLDVVTLLTMVDEAGERSRSHGLSLELLAAQAERVGCRQVTVPCSWDTYDREFGGALLRLRADDVTHVIFGDILLDEHRRWAERMCGGAGMTAVEPLWGTPTRDVARAFVASGATAIIVTTRAHVLDASWLGRRLTPELLRDLERMGVDPCGELGEYHSVVLDCALFDRPLAVESRGQVLRSGCYALDLGLAREKGTGAPRL